MGYTWDDITQNRTQWRACVDGTEQDTVESLCGWHRTGHSGELVWMAQNRTQWRACVDGIEQDTVESLCG